MVEVKSENKKFVDHLGNEYDSVSDMAQEYGLGGELVVSRMKLGWSIEKALTEPVRKRKPKVIEESTNKEYIKLYLEKVIRLKQLNDKDKKLKQLERLYVVKYRGKELVLEEICMQDLMESLKSRERNCEFNGAKTIKVKAKFGKTNREDWVLLDNDNDDKRAVTLCITDDIEGKKTREIKAKPVNEKVVV